MMDHLSLVPYEGGSSGGGGAGAGAKYKECLRNHAAAMGGQAFDGCGEYMEASPDSLKCAACGCHRSFHRRAGMSGGIGLTGVSGAAPFFFSPPPPPSDHHHPPQPHHPVLQGFVPSSRPPQLALPYHAVPAAAWHHGLLDPARSGSETPPRAGDDCSPGCGGGSGSFGRKRHRTKFTPEQKERMRDFAERQGWRINRDDGGALDRFCLEIGVKRNVLKVWMHNHKHQLASPTSAAAAAAATAGIGGMGINPAPGAGVSFAMGVGVGAGMGIGMGAGSGAGMGMGMGAGARTGDGDDDDDTDDDSPPRAAVSSPSPSPISV